MKPPSASLLVTAAVAALLSVAGAACQRVFPCQEDRECIVGDLEYGICLAHLEKGTAYCAWPQPRCPSGWRWDTYADGSLARRCVDPSLVKARANGDGGQQGN